MAARHGARVTRPFRFGLQSYAPESGDQWRALARAGRRAGLLDLQCGRSRHRARPGTEGDQSSGADGRRDPRDGRGCRGDHTASASVAACCASTIATRSCWPRNWPRSTSSRTAGSRSDWAQDGWRTSTRRWACVRRRRSCGSIVWKRRSPCCDPASPTASWTQRGKHVHAVGFEAVPKPVQRPMPPLMIGGGSPRSSASPVAKPTSSASTSTTRRASWARPASVRRRPS